MTGRYPHSVYLDVEGQTLGPFSSEDVLGMLREGEILPHHRVRAATSTGELDETSPWITLQEFQSFETIQPPPPPVQASPRPFKALGTIDQSRIPVAPTSTAHRLFDLLQVAREHRTAKFNPPPIRVTPPSKPLFKESRRLVAGGATLGILVGLGLYYGSGSKAPLDDRRPSSASVPVPVAAPVARPITPPAFMRQAPLTRPMAPPAPGKIQISVAPAPAQTVTIDAEPVAQATHAPVDERDKEYWDQAAEPIDQDGNRQPGSQPDMGVHGKPSAELINQMAQDAGIPPSNENPIDPVVQQ